MTVYRVGDWTVRPDLNQMISADTEVTLEPRILAVLNCFVAHPGKVLNRDLLIEEAWNGIIVSESTINHTVGVLRRALGDKARDPQYIQTVAKKGYRLVANVTEFSQENDLPAPISQKPSSPSAKRRYLLYAAMGFVSLGAIANLFFASQPIHEAGFRFTVSKPLTSLQGMETSPELDPAGEWLYFSYTEKGQQTADLYRQRLTGGLPELVFAATGTAHETSPAISPEGDRLAYARFSDAGCSIMLHYLNTEKPMEELANCGPYSPQIDWTPNGDILFAGAPSKRTPSRIQRIRIDSGRINEITDADHGVGDYTYALSHDGERIAFLRTTHWNHSDLFIKDIASGKETLLRQFPTWFFDVTWTADNRTIIYAPEPSQRKLEALDTETLHVSEVYSQSKGLFGYQGLKTVKHLIATERSWDTNIYSAPIRSGIGSLHETQTPALVASTRSDWQPRITKDGNTLSFLSDRTGEQEIWASDMLGKNARQLSHLDGEIQIHVFDWDPAGSNITFDGYDDRIYVLDTETGNHTAITPIGMMARNPSFSNDGAHVIFTSDQGGDWQIWRIETAGGTPEKVTQKGGFSARYSVDGELYVTKYYKDGLWKVDEATGDEQLVVPNMITGPMQQWTLRNDGVYFLNNQIGQTQIFYYDWANKKTELLHDIPHIGFTFELSFDGKNILFTRDDSRASDIVILR